MSSSTLEPLAIEQIWAKSPRKPAEHGETLTHHLISVGHRVLELIERHRVSSETIGGVRPAHAAFWAAVLHDAGKIASHFQEMLRGKRKSAGYRHEVLSLLFAGGAPAKTEQERSVIVGAIASHHRDADNKDVFGDVFSGVGTHLIDGDAVKYLGGSDPANSYGGKIDLNVARELKQFFAVTLPREFGDRGRAMGIDISYATDLGVPIGGPARANLLWEQLTRYRDLWKRVRKDPAGDLACVAMLVRGLVLLADRLASAGSEQIESLNLPDETALLPNCEIRPHQRAASAGGSPMLLRAPTGFGKTEAALLWARSTKRRALVYILPYQASLNAMQSRLKRQLGTDIGLLHARSVSALLQAMTDDLGAGSSVALQVRRARDFARLFQQPCVVSTPYQLLRAAYGIKGYPLIWAALANAAIVLDEIHAYEPFRTGLFLEFAAHLHERWNAPVLAMSATLPRWLRDGLESRFNTSLLEPPTTELANIKGHRIILEPDCRIASDETIARVIQLASDRSVLVIANTVNQATKIYRAVSASATCPTLLLHSRFTAEDRSSKEGAALKMGTGRPCILVATQVVEVSLDIDFDTMITEIAPFEALVQRLGRVNRRALREPAGVCVVGTNSPRPYEQHLLDAAWAVLEGTGGGVIDESKTADLLDAAYAISGADLWCSEQLAKGMRALANDVLPQVNAFSSGGEITEDSFDSLFDGLEAIAAQHLGEYRRRKDEDPLRARLLTIPLSFRQKRQFGVEFNKELRIYVANADYDSERGLVPCTFPP